MAAGNVKSVSVVFQAFTDKFEKKTAKAGQSIGGFAKKAAGLVGGFIAGRAAIRKLASSFESLDRFGKLSDRMQIDPKALRGLELMGSQTGTSFTQIEKGVQRMSRTIGEARQGITTGTTALKDLGLTASDFDGLNVEQQYKMIADRIKGIADPSQKAAVAFRIFGRSGQEMTNMLNMGADGLEKFKEEAEALGGPVTREDLAKIEAANDSIDKMGKAFQGMFDQLAIRLAPAMKIIVDYATEFLKASQKIFEVWDNVQGAIEDAISDLFHGGEGKEIVLGGPVDFKSKGFTSDIKPAVIEKVVKFNAKAFSDGAQFQSSKAFDILNPNRAGSVQKDQLNELKAIKDAVQKQSDKETIALVEKEI